MSRLLLVLFAVVYVVRFAVPAMAGGAGAPFGVPWLHGTGTPFLDSDLRYFGVTAASVAALFLLGSADAKRFRPMVDLLMLGVGVGAAVRTGELALGAHLPPPALVATLLEWAVPLLWFVASASDAAAEEHRLEASVTSTASPEALWMVFADFGGVHLWHPYMASATLEAGPDVGVGASRVCRFGPRMAIRETVLEWEQRRMEIAIAFLEGLPPPIHDVRAAVRTEATPSGGRLVLTMRYRTRWGPLGTLAQPLIDRQYRAVFADMLAAADAWATERRTLPPRVMPGSGRVVA